MTVDLLERKRTHFILWRPAHADPAPTLYIGQISFTDIDRYSNFREIPLRPASQSPDLWEAAAQECGLSEGQVYFYWFKVRNADPADSPEQVMQLHGHPYRVFYCTDPLAYTVDRRFPAPAPAEPGGDKSGDPASVVLYRQGQLVPCDPDGHTVNWDDDSLDTLPANNRLVIYELPTRWAKGTTTDEFAIGIGTFRDVLALVQQAAVAPDFATVDQLQANHAHLLELGVNALELLPPADSDDIENWGYGTANYFAADFHLGQPDAQASPTASTDLAKLIQACHQQDIRFFPDVVMAFSRNNPYRNINFLDFYIQWKHRDDPTRDPEQGDRDGFGGDLFKYNYWVEGYDPISGEQSSLVPARQYLKAHVAHWLTYYRVDGLRLDSVNNIANYDFLQEFKDLARSIWAERGGSADRFLVVGEDLSVPLALVHQQRLDGLWNERFKHMSRKVILGKSADGESSFEWSVRKLIDCRLLGFRDGAQAVNYLTSHDVGGYSNERIYNYLVSNQVNDAEARIKLAFVCLMTAVGIPMILAGDEFADQHDLDISDEHASHKQVDPVNYSRMSDPWRRRLFDYVARLVRFRTTSEALATNDTQFIHVDFEEGKRVLVWQRGYGESLVIVVANFSDYGTPNAGEPNAEYVIPNWAATPASKQWREITQNRIVSPDWVGREPIFPWEAKVYALESSAAA